MDHDPTHIPEANTPNRREGVKSVLSTLLLLLMAPLIAVVLTVFVFQSYEVDGQSMERSLQNHDRLIVLKVAKTWSKITSHDYIPNRGDVIIFNRHNLFEVQGGAGGDKQLIKRVIALPHERVVIKDGVVKVFNPTHPEGFVPDDNPGYHGFLPNTTEGDLDLTISDSEVFVLGDNRSNSMDSRIFGPVSANDIVGKLVVRVFPFNKTKLF